MFKILQREFQGLRIYHFILIHIAQWLDFWKKDKPTIIQKCYLFLIYLWKDIINNLNGKQRTSDKMWDTLWHKMESRCPVFDFSHSYPYLITKDFRRLSLHLSKISCIITLVRRFFSISYNFLALIYRIPAKVSHGTQFESELNILKLKSKIYF